MSINVFMIIRIYSIGNIPVIGVLIDVIYGASFLMNFSISIS